MAFSSPLTGNQGTVPPPSAPGVSGVLPGQKSINTTRILSLTSFSKELKTRDIQNIFIEFEEDRGGYRIKWLDDTGCLIVFNDPLTAKKAFLHLLANPHPHLLPFANPDGEPGVPKLAPYIGEDASQVVQSVQNRPRSRSVAGGPGNSPAHHRRMSNSSSMGSAGGARLAASVAANGATGTSGVGNGSLSRSFGRASMSQHQMQAIIDEASSGAEEGPGVNGMSSASPPSPSAASGNSNGGAIDWNAYQQQQQHGQAARVRAGSGSIHDPARVGSPERGMQGSGATSPSRLRRVLNSRA